MDCAKDSTEPLRPGSKAHHLACGENIVRAPAASRMRAAEMNPWRKWRLGVSFVEAQAALGECMYAAGIDDGELGAKISALNEQLRRAEAVGGSTQALKAARRQVVLQLAAAALEDDGPLPGADAEYRRAREAQAALDRHETGVDARRSACLA